VVVATGVFRRCRYRSVMLTACEIDGDEIQSQQKPCGEERGESTKHHKTEFKRCGDAALLPPVLNGAKTLA